MALKEIITKLKDEMKNLERYNDIEVKDDIIFEITSIHFFLAGFATQLIDGKTISLNTFEKKRLREPFLENEKLNGHEVQSFDLKDYPNLKEYAFCLDKIRKLVLEVINDSRT